MSTFTSSTDKSFIEIVPYKGWQFIDFRELLRYKELFYFFVLKDIKIRYKQTILGNLWGIIQPFLMMIVLSVFFGFIARISTDGVPYAVFYMTALVPWTFFSKAVANASGSLVNSSFLISKVYFPRVIIPLTPVVAGLWDFVFTFIVLVFLMFFYGIVPTFQIIFVPLLVILMMLASSGVGLLLSAFSAKYRDVEYAMGFLLQVWMFSSPVFFPVSLVPEKYQLLYALNPMVGVIVGFRSVIIGHIPFPLEFVLISFTVSTLLFVIGAFFFKHTEYYFADVI
jgi:homopolymeric O-antigen transport system permease protein